MGEKGLLVVQVCKKWVEPSSYCSKRLLGHFEPSETVYVFMSYTPMLNLEPQIPKPRVHLGAL